MPSIAGQEVDTAGPNGVYLKTQEGETVREHRIYAADILLHYTLVPGGLSIKYQETRDWVVLALINATGGTVSPEQVTFEFNILTGQPTEMTIAS